MNAHINHDDDELVIASDEPSEIYALKKWAEENAIKVIDEHGRVGVRYKATKFRIAGVYASDVLMRLGNDR